LCGYYFTEMAVSLNLNDRPVGYAPPIGPPVYTQVSYNQRDAARPANPNFFNVSPKWSLNWLSWIEDDPTMPTPTGVRRFVAGGGYTDYSGYQSSTRSFTPDPMDASVLVRASSSPIVYQRQLADGGMEVYAKSDGATSNPRRLFLSQIIDPAGNTLTFNYDSRLRLTSITDATQRSTKFSYDLTTQPLLVTKITDPFGRYAQFGYDSTGRLISITDVLNITSKFTYDPSNPNANFIKEMDTPYGATTFSTQDIPDKPGPQCPSLPCGSTRILSATDPLGNTEFLMAERDTRILKMPPPHVFVESLTGAGLLLNFRIWASHDNVGELQRTIIEQAMYELEAAGIEALQPQQVVRIIPPDTDPSRLLPFPAGAE